MKAIIASVLLLVLSAASVHAGRDALRSPLCCSICGAPHGNLIGNGICLDCNKREFDIRPNGGGTVAERLRVRR